ncbi:MAG: thioredoxin family protein [Bacteroidales bacterium]|nr:thioredoxin family protein [Bacteroidales bacterium]
MMYLVDFYTSWCGYCKKMDRQTFTDPVVSAIVNAYYYPVKFNAESEPVFSWNGVQYQMTTGGSRGVHQFAQAILGRQMGFPSFAIFRPDRSLIQVIPGYYPPADFARLLWYFASGDYERYAYGEYVKIFDTRIRPEMMKQLKMN